MNPSRPPPPQLIAPQAPAQAAPAALQPAGAPGPGAGALVPAGGQLAPATYPPDAHPAALYLAHLQGAGRRSMASTVEGLARLLGRTAQDTPWHLLRYQHTQLIWTRLADSGMKPATVKKYLAALRGVLVECRRLGLMSADDFMRATDLPRVRGETMPAGRSLARHEVVALLAICAKDTSLAGVRDLALLHTAAFTGMRLAEVLTLPVEAAGDAVRILGKGNVEREGFLPADSVAAVEAWLRVRGSAPGPLFLHVSGDKVTAHGLSATSLRSILRRRAALAGVARFTPHDLRRTFATQTLAAGADLAVVQRLMGHKDIRTTARYDRRGADAAQAAVEQLAGAYGVKDAQPLATKRTMLEVFLVERRAEIDDIRRGRGAGLMQRALDGGYVTCTEVPLREEAFAAEFLAQFSGGDEHRQLCALGARWIEARDLLWSAQRPRCRYAGTGVADVMSLDGKIAVECGHTEPAKLVLGVAADGLTGLYIPFPAPLGLRQPKGFLFERTAKPTDDALAEIIDSAARSQSAHAARGIYERKLKRGNFEDGEQEELIGLMYESVEAKLWERFRVSPVPPELRPKD